VNSSISVTEIKGASGSKFKHMHKFTIKALQLVQKPDTSKANKELNYDLNRVPFIEKVVLFSKRKDLDRIWVRDRCSTDMD